MIYRRTALVLGAGASMPYGFPSGAELLSQIIDISDDWWPIAEGFNLPKALHKQLQEYIRDSGVYSIDELVGHRQDTERYAKTITAYLVAKREHLKNLTGERKGDWMRYLHRLMFDTPSGIDALTPPPLSVITFNYDRSFEKATLERAKVRYGDKAKQKLRGIEVLHVHGQLGPLKHWSDGEPHLPYDGALLNRSVIESAAKNIKFIQDQDKDSPEFLRAQQMLEEAEVVIFLGCAMHRENVQRLRPDVWVGNRKRLIFVCAKDMQRGRIQKVRSALSGESPLEVLNPQFDAYNALLEIEDHFSM